MGSVEDPSGGQAKEVPITLDISCWSHGNGPNGLRSHGVIMLFMGLNIFTQLKLAVPVEVNCATNNNGAGAQIV